MSGRQHTRRICVGRTRAIDGERTENEDIAPMTCTGPPPQIIREWSSTVNAFCRPLQPVFLLVSFPRSRSPVVGVLGVVLVIAPPV